MSEVAVLMSTYNGQEYLQQQVDSILNQTYQDLTLYIRDDGSTDRTREIIESYDKRDSRVIFLRESSSKNLGPQASFFELLKNTKANYYMFSDQDDVWETTKIEKTLKEMNSAQKEYGNIPINVFTNLLVVDKKLSEIELMNPEKLDLSFLSLLFHNVITGCTMMINNPLKDKINFDQLNYKNTLMHDWWIGLLAALFGKNIYLDEATIKYRQHGDNTVGMNKHNTVKRIASRIMHLSKETEIVKKVEHLSIELKKEYPNDFKELQRKYVEGYSLLSKKSSFLYNIKLIKKCPPVREHPLFFSLIMVLFSRELRF